MSTKPLWSMAGLALGCVVLAGCGHCCGHRKTCGDTCHPGMYGSPPAGQAQSRVPANPSSGLPPLGGTGGASLGGSPSTPITPAGLANPAAPNNSAGKPYNGAGANSAMPTWDQAPAVPPRLSTVATSSTMEKPATPPATPDMNNQGYVIPKLSAAEKPPADPNMRQTIMPQMPAYQEEGARPPSSPATSTLPASPNPDSPNGK